MLQRFGCPTPTVYAFASTTNYPIPRYWTDMHRAWQHAWSKKFIWADLPFKWLAQVVKKFFSDKADGILLMPDYSSKCVSKQVAYRGALDCLTLEDYTFPPHTKLLSREIGKALGPTPLKEATLALWVDWSLDALPSEVDIARNSGWDFDMRIPLT